MSRKPRVVIVATRAPRRSISALVASVVPWMKPAMSDQSAPAMSSAMRRTSSAPSDGSAGVVAVLAVAMTVAAASIRTVSVKVPPISMASRRGWDRSSWGPGGMSSGDGP
jgi:hypothetical protein